MMKRINAVAPGVGPIVCGELFLHLRRRICALHINDARGCRRSGYRLLGNHAVIFENSSLGLFLMSSPCEKPHLVIVIKPRARTLPPCRCARETRTIDLRFVIHDRFLRWISRTRSQNPLNSEILRQTFIRYLLFAIRLDKREG